MALVDLQLQPEHSQLHSPFTVSFTTPIVAATGNRSHPGIP
jgi:hypothetical protein